MSGVKRISLTPLASTKKVKTCPKTHRFELALPESTEQSCPEFNFADLLTSVTQKKKDIPGQNGHAPLDPYAEDDEDQLRAMAKKFEEKYGVVPTKKKKSKKDDYVDLGAGYDETDPFIDNTDAYDEVVPTDLTTAYGGFYINSGALEFKAAEEGSGSDSSSESSSESESDSESDRNSNRNEPVSRKRRMIESDDETSEPEMNGKEADNEEASKKMKVEEPAAKKKPVTTDDAKLKKLKSAAKESAKSDSERENAKTEDKRTSDSGSQTSESSSSDSSDSSSSGSESSSSSSSEDEADDEDKVPEQDGTNKDGSAQLPNLPAQLQVLVDDIKKAAALSAAGKCRFFSPEVNSMLLKIELQSRQLSCSKRQSIYNHLENFLPCTKHTLLKRAKNLVIEEVEGQIKPAIKKLQAAVERVLPEQIERHASECQRLAEAKDPDLEPAGGTDDEAKKNGASKSAPPRRKFEWNQEIKSLLNKAVYLKAQCFQWSKLRKESGDEYITRFLEAEIKILWPRGWMSTKILLKESKGAWDLITDGKKLGPQKLAPLAASLSEVLPKPSPAAPGPSQGSAKTTSSASPSPVPKTPTAASTTEKSAASSATHTSKSAAAPGQTPKVSVPSPAASFTPKSAVPPRPVTLQSNPALDAATPLSSTSKEAKRVREKSSAEASSPLNLKSESAVRKQQDRPMKPAFVDENASAAESFQSTKREGTPSAAGLKGDFPEKPLLFVKNDEVLKGSTKPDTLRQNSNSSLPSSISSVVESGVVDLADSPEKPPEIIDMSRSSESDACDRELSLQRDLAQVMEVLTNFGGETSTETKKQDVSKPSWNFTEPQKTETSTQPRSSVISTPPSGNYKNSSPPKLPSPSPKYSASGSESFTPPAAHSSSRGQSYFSNNSNQSSPSPERRKMDLPFPAHQQQSSVPPAAHQQHSSSSSALGRSSLMRGFTPPGGSSSSSSSVHRTNSYHSIDSLAQTSRLTSENFSPALSRHSSSGSLQQQQQQQQHQLPRIEPVYSSFPTISKSSSSRTTPAQPHAGYGFFNPSGSGQQHHS